MIRLGVMVVKGIKFSVKRNDRQKGKTFVANVFQGNKSSDTFVAQEENIRYIKQSRFSEMLFLATQYNDIFRSLEKVEYDKIAANYNCFKPWRQSLYIERNLQDQLDKLRREHEQKTSALTTKYNLILEYAEEKVQPKFKTKAN